MGLRELIECGVGQPLAPLSPEAVERALRDLFASVEPPKRLIVSVETYQRLRRAAHAARVFARPHAIGKRKFRFVQTPRGIKLRPYRPEG